MTDFQIANRLADLWFDEASEVVVYTIVTAKVYFSMKLYMNLAKVFKTFDHFLMK